MCGFAGFITNNKFDFKQVSKDMSDSINFRGPDDSGFYQNLDFGLFFSFRRLAIIELTSKGHQPMISDDKRYVMIFNGEIYNYKELYGEAKINQDESKQNTSDTYLLINLISKIGLENTLKKIEGMFSIVLWDNKLKEITLIRDRIGEKPLYYGLVNNSFIFGSDIRVFRKFPNFNNKINKNNLSLYFRYLNIPSPHTIYEKIYKLEPGCFLKIPHNQISNMDNIFPIKEDTDNGKYNIIYKRWWNLNKIAKKSYHNQIGDKNFILNKLEFLLEQSVNSMSYADVDMGVFLSGGIDSSLVSSILQKNSSQSINTFSIGFENKKYDEAKFAKKIANHLGTKHNEIYLTENDALDIIPQLSNIYSEPFADSSQIPTYLLCKNVNKHMKVALSGDGGDEFFGGYNRYIWIKNIWINESFISNRIKQIIINLILRLKIKNIDILYSIIKIFIPKNKQINFFGQKLEKVAQRFINIKNPDELYKFIVSEWSFPNELLLNTYEPEIPIDSFDNSFLSENENNLMIKDSLLYLPDDILVKTDRASMYSSLEVRSPFLNSQLIDFSWQIPLEYKIKNGQGKMILRDLLSRYLPQQFFQRPKQGFSAPILNWLKGPLKEWAYSLISNIDKNEFMNNKLIMQKWNEHQSGARNWDQSLWSVIMFLDWHKNNSN